MTSEKTSIVVIGGSYAGTGVCHGLLRQLSNIKVTLINPRDEYYFNIASPRLLVKPDIIPRDKYIFSISDAFKKYPAESFQFIQGKACQIDTVKKLVKIENDVTPDVHYDYLVIASGSTTPATIGRDSFPAPFKAPVDGGLGDAIDRTQSAIQSAESIIIGGAGPVGVEFAGEIVEAYSARKNVTLISGTEKVLPGLVDSGRDAAGQILRDKDVVLKTGCLIERVLFDDDDNQWSVALSNDETLTADLYVSAMGPVPNNGFIPSSLLDDQGWVDVDQHLRARNTQADIYAVGDITSHKDRLLLRVEPQVSVVVANLRRDITGEGRLSSFLPEEQRNVMIVPIGKSTGTGMIGGWRVWGFMVSLMKGRHYFLGRAASYIQG